MSVHSPVNGTTAIPWRSSSRKKLTLLEKLRGCQEAWCPGASWDRDQAHAAIRGTPTGSFLVVCDSVTSLPSLLCVSAGLKDILDFKIECTGTGFQLSESRLSFSDLVQLVLFHSLTRDVLPVSLSLPHWIYSVTETSRDRLTHLEPKTWLFPEDQQNDAVHKEPFNVTCSIQLTSSNGALFIINPLYMHEHEDDRLTHKAPAAKSPTMPSNFRQARRLSTTRPWAGSGLQSKRAASLDQESSAASSESSGLNRSGSADSAMTPQTLSGVVLRRPSQEFAPNPPYKLSTRSLPPSSPSTPGGAVPELQRHSSPVPQSPHRVSWIEDGIWLPPPRPSSLLHPSSLELDSLSVSSIEEEQESPVASSAPHLPSAHRLADKVIHRLSAVGQALGGLVSPKKRLTNRVVELSERKGGAFAEAVKEFVEATLKKEVDSDKVVGSEFLQEVRTSLTSLRETLLEYSEIQVLLDSITDMNDAEIDSLVELSLHKVALKPVSTHLYSYIRASRTSDGSIERFQTNLHVLELNAVDELGGSPGVGVPDAVTLERIQQRWTSMHEAYSPNKKVQILLKVCKTIYHSMTANGSSGKVFGADDFLPCLTWVLLRGDLFTLQIDTDYMMELLDPAQLQGEGGYYLTTLYAALFYISSFRPRLAVRQLSVEAQQSLNQWHRRRTLHCNQSRRSQNRRTIRRPMCRERGTQETENDAKTTEKSREDCSSGDPNDQRTESSTETLQTLNEDREMEQETRNLLQTPGPNSEVSPQYEIAASSDRSQSTVSAAGVEDFEGDERNNFR
ncbi:unnamed protein product [Ophioblennius macclurei]